VEVENEPRQFIELGRKRNMLDSPNKDTSGKE